MNIFFVDRDPVIAAKMLCDSHVVKMILESAQMLCTAHRVLDGVESEARTKSGRRQKVWNFPDPKSAKQKLLYKAAYVNHPCTVWVRYSEETYSWLFQHFCQLLEEYKLRYNREHACTKLLPVFVFLPWHFIAAEKKGWIDPPACMPIMYIDPTDIVQSYRTYYIEGKRHLHTWGAPRRPPDWIESHFREQPA